MGISGKIILYGILIAFVLMLLLASFGIISVNFGGKTAGNSVSSGSYDSLPEKCRVPAGQDINSWKEHLSHHAETQDCLKYFN